MAYLLFPGRHLVHTYFQEKYIASFLNGVNKPILGEGPKAEEIDTIIFAVTSSNRSKSKYNPIPFHLRMVETDRFAQRLKGFISKKIQYKIIGISHLPKSDRFARHTLFEISCATNFKDRLTPENTVVITSTPELIQQYQDEGFAVLPAEYDVEKQQFADVIPNTIIQQMATGESTEKERALRLLSPSTCQFFQDYPEAIERILTLYHDPILKDHGDLTETRNYRTYTAGMNEVIDLKYQDIKPFIPSGSERIFDEGCSDGSLIERMVQDFPDADFVGVDLSAEMLDRAIEKKRQGAFGESFVYFRQRNLETPIEVGQARSADTIICNSTLHELYSYGEGEQSIRHYLAWKKEQLKPGGRLIIRDMVGPENGDQEVLLWTDYWNTGTSTSRYMEMEPEKLAIRSRFLRFARDHRRDKEPPLPFTVVRTKDDVLFKMKLRHAMEFILKMDYTDNWESETQESFCFWSFSDWKRELETEGYRVLEGSHAYVNQWRVENRFNGKVRLFDLNQNPLPFPVTNMILAAERPR